MLDTKDIEILRGMFRENNEIFGAQLKREIRDEIHASIKASESGLIREIRATETRILDAMGSMMDVQIAPRLDEHDAEILTIKRHLKLA